MTAIERNTKNQRDSRASRIASGQKLVQVMLTKRAAKKLERICKAGESAASVISQLLERSKP